MTVPEDQLLRRAMHGSAFLLAQRLAATALAFAGNIALARLLFPQEFGIFAATSFIVLLALTVADLGGGFALIHADEAPTRQVVGLTWVTHALWATLVAGVVWLTAPAIAGAFGLSTQGTWMLRTHMLLVPLATLALPPTLVLERGLRYGVLSLAETLETVAFVGLAILIALAGVGAWSLILAALGGSLLRTGLLWVRNPVQIAPAWEPERLKTILGFGLRVQLGQLLVVLRDGVSPLLVGLWVGITELGYLAWAASVALAPLLVTSVSGRALFAAYARVQHDPPRLSAMVERSLRLVVTVLVPAVGFLWASGESLVRHLYGGRWQPALPAFYWFCASAIPGGLTNILLTFLSGAGRPGARAGVLLAWGLTYWALAGVLVPRYGFVGAAIASAACSLLVLALTLREARRVIPLDLGRATAGPLVAAVPATLLVYLVQAWWDRGLWSLGASLVIGGGLYLVILARSRQRLVLIDDLRLLAGPGG